jgi:hypothetical protein
MRPFTEVIDDISEEDGYYLRGVRTDANGATRTEGDLAQQRNNLVYLRLGEIQKLLAELVLIEDNR